MDEIDDFHLLDRIKRGDQSALAALYTRHSPAVYALAYYILHNREMAQEVTQDFFVDLWKTPHHWDAGKGQFAHWLTRVTRHMAIDRLRHEQRRAPRHLLAYDEAVADFLPHMHSLGDSKDQAHLVRHLLGQLPKDQSKVILMAYFKGMTYEEIAEVLGVPHGTVKSRLRLGLQKLRALWHSANHESHSSPVFSRQLTDEER